MHIVGEKRQIKLFPHGVKQRQFRKLATLPRIRFEYDKTDLA